MWINERLYKEYRQSFDGKILFKKKTPFQLIEIVQTTTHGKILFLDGVVQITEKDEYIYHEMLVHVPLFSHPNPQHVLVIGGGDGGAIRRVLEHPTVQSITLVEIDSEVVRLSKKYFKKISDNAFSHKKVTIIHEDGASYMAHNRNTYDVIITDRGDPIGPVRKLFEKEYYTNCKKRLNKDGILIALTGVPFLQREELTETMKLLRDVFTLNTYYLVPVPTYIGGTLAITWSSDTLSPFDVNWEELMKKYKKTVTQYYTPAVHRASFALPKNLEV